jgi:hypothetical protein
MNSLYSRMSNGLMRKMLTIACGGMLGFSVVLPAKAAKAPVIMASFDVLREPAELPDGTLMAIGLQYHSGVQEVNAEFSHDGGHSWSGPQTLFNLPREAGGFGYFKVLVDRNGEVHIFFLCDGNTGGALPIEGGGATPAKEILDIWQAKSKNKVAAWEPIRRIWSGQAGDLLSAIQLGNGRILLPISYVTDRTWAHRGSGFDAYTFMGKYNCGMLYSDDEGETWQQSASVLEVPTPDAGDIGGAEPVVLELQDGRIWMLIRTQMGRFYESFSRDKGLTWSRPRATGIVSSESPAGLIRLGDRRVVLFVNGCQRFPYGHGGRYVIHAAISEDDGRTWRGFREVVRAPLRDAPPPPNGDYGVAYPFLALTKTGEVVFSPGVLTGTRSQHPQGPGKLGHPEKRPFYLLHPTWLYETHQTDDFSHGLDNWSIFGTRGVELAPHPGGVNRQALLIRKADTDWQSSAVWNFPAGRSGRLRVRILIKPGFQGALLGLTDHFSVPFDEEDVFFNVFNLRLAPGDQISKALGTNVWHDMELDWDCSRQEVRVIVDAHQVALMRQMRIPQNQGISYLRLRSVGESGDDAGFMIESVDVAVSGKDQGD